MERMVNDRLVWFLEKNKLIATIQKGFRTQRGTLDHLVRFETFIRQAFIKKNMLFTYFSTSKVLTILHGSIES